MSGGTGHRIAVISDTHNMLRPEVVEVIKTCDAVLHGGDISGPATTTATGQQIYHTSLKCSYTAASSI